VHTIRPRERLKDPETIAQSHGVVLEAIDVVESIKDWCTLHNIDESNPHRMGKTVRNLQTGLCRILLADEIKPSMQSGVCFVLMSRGFGDEVAALHDSDIFLTLFLHELAHARDSDASEQECDEWAFKELGAYAA
jgi:hypothetical protein